jgi:hypothetical protein
MFKSKFEKNYDRELKREIRIQQLMKEKSINRRKAVHYFDYENEIHRQNLWSKKKII